ncbi:MAG TPA: cytochrome c [Acidimicrobiales bacterium]|nr:cytochrome c [Acidimicrobiales bacterium]
MTEVPEYLLRRSRERREALGLLPEGGGSPGDDAPEGGGAAKATATATEAPPAEQGEAPSSAPAVPDAAPPAAAASTEAEAPTEALPTYLPPPGPKNGIPVWMYPVLVVLPLWAIVYLGSFGSRGGPVSPMDQGRQIYASACASCHGASGGGGIGPKLSGGESALTFPNEEDHVTWVQNGSSSRRGQPYGDPNRPGGARVASTGQMPGFSGQLSDAQIRAVVLFEREGM